MTVRTTRPLWYNFVWSISLREQYGAELLFWWTSTEDSFSIELEKEIIDNGVFLLQEICIKCIIFHVIRISQIFALICLFLVGALSLSSICPDLHSFLFHGDTSCPHACDNDPYNSGEKEENQKGVGENSCAVVLFGQGIETQTHFQFSTFSELSSNVEFSSVRLIWSTYKHAPFGARDPPVLELV